MYGTKKATAKVTTPSLRQWWLTMMATSPVFTVVMVLHLLEGSHFVGGGVLWVWVLWLHPAAALITSIMITARTPARQAQAACTIFLSGMFVSFFWFLLTLHKFLKKFQL